MADPTDRDMVPELRAAIDAALARQGGTAIHAARRASVENRSKRHLTLVHSSEKAESHE